VAPRVDWGCRPKWYAGMAGLDETFQGVLGLVNK
jgi:hypothetical protein